MNEWLPEQIKTIRNLCDVAQVLLNVGKYEYMPTILEIMLEHVQQVVDENCVVKDGI